MAAVSAGTLQPSQAFWPIKPSCDNACTDLAKSQTRYDCAVIRRDNWRSERLQQRRGGAHIQDSGPQFMGSTEPSPLVMERRLNTTLARRLDTPPLTRLRC